MMRFFLFAILAVASVGHAAAQADNCTMTPKESGHVSGPHGLEGWTLKSTISGYSDPHACFSRTLVLARNGQVIRRREAQPIIWNWTFWENGRQLAIEEGALHFDMRCVLEDLETGRTLATFDCYHNSSKDGPDWVKALEPL